LPPRGPAVMTPDKVRVAREMYASRRYTVAAIAKTLGVSRASIYRHLPAAVAAQAAGAEDAKERIR
jgi:DNA invertase Pin-like site-specific DNA recombinase